MDFSDEWRSLWPVSNVFPAPSLISSSSAASPMIAGPLLFRPSSPPLSLITSAALQTQTPLPLFSLLDGLRTFFRSPSNRSFLPSAAFESLAADLLPGEPAAARNLLVSLRCRGGGGDKSALALFFPVGDNAHSIGYLGLSFNSGSPEIALDSDGGVFRQLEGFKHPFHRISMMSVSPAAASPIDSPIEGFLMAATLYSVNWFTVETRVLESGRDRPFLVPTAKQGFESPVVHACWSPHFSEECAVLLENGDLCWFNLSTKRCEKIRVRVKLHDDDDGGDRAHQWLSCEFGGQPWVLIVACSTAVVLVDLIRKDDGFKVLARVDMLDADCVAPQMANEDRFLTFCKGRYNDFHVALLCERRLLLFDIRKPLVPVLSWDHGLKDPSYVVMFRLSELRPSNDFKWASESGFAILAGSFCRDEFNLFCFGPVGRGGARNKSTSLYAWELPSCIPLSGWVCSSGDRLLKEIFSEEKFLGTFFSHQNEDVLAGFCIVPTGLLRMGQESGGFALIRLMASGKLEMQNFNASSESFGDISNCKDEDLIERNESTVCRTNHGGVSTRYDYVKLRYLYAYMNGNLSNILVIPGPQPCYEEINQNFLGRDLMEFCNKLKSSSPSVSSFVSDVSIPTSIFEIALRRSLIGLRSDLLPLAFSKYSDLLRRNGEVPFEFLEVSSCLPHQNLQPFFMVKPSRRSGKWSKKAMPGEILIGPVLPIPVLLSLQNQFEGVKKPSLPQNADFLDYQCKEILENVFPETSIADIGNEWDVSEEILQQKPYFVYESTQMSKSLDPMKQASSPCETATEEKKFATFVCGINDSGHKPIGLEMLDLSPITLDFEPSALVFESGEQKINPSAFVPEQEIQPRDHDIYKCLKRQFSKWQDGYMPYQDFCASNKIPKLDP